MDTDLPAPPEAEGYLTLLMGGFDPSAFRLGFARTIGLFAVGLGGWLDHFRHAQSAQLMRFNHGKMKTLFRNASIATVGLAVANVSFADSLIDETTKEVLTHRHRRLVRTKLVDRRRGGAGRPRPGYRRDAQA